MKAQKRLTKRGAMPQRSARRRNNLKVLGGGPEGKAQQEGRGVEILLAVVPGLQLDGSSRYDPAPVARQACGQKAAEIKLAGFPGQRVCLTSDQGPDPGKEASAEAVPGLESIFGSCGKLPARGVYVQAPPHRNKIGKIKRSKKKIANQISD